MYARLVLVASNPSLASYCRWRLSGLTRTIAAHGFIWEWVDDETDVNSPIPVLHGAIKDTHHCLHSMFWDNWMRSHTSISVWSHVPHPTLHMPLSLQWFCNLTNVNFKITTRFWIHCALTISFATSKHCHMWPIVLLGCWWIKTFLGEFSLDKRNICHSCWQHLWWNFWQQKMDWKTVFVVGVGRAKTPPLPS